MKLRHTYTETDTHQLAGGLLGAGAPMPVVLCRHSGIEEPPAEVPLELAPQLHRTNSREHNAIIFIDYLVYKYLWCKGVMKLLACCVTKCCIVPQVLNGENNIKILTLEPNVLQSYML